MTCPKLKHIDGKDWPYDHTYDGNCVYRIDTDSEESAGRIEAEAQKLPGYVKRSASSIPAKGGVRFHIYFKP